MSEPGPYSVIQVFEQAWWEKVGDHLSPEDAVNLAERFTKSVAARMGITREVLITDEDDECVFLWRYGEGIVFPHRAPVEEGRVQDGRSDPPRL